jgi:threonine dehydrogenase-like Zn-dependent dehydrogenase
MTNYGLRIYAPGDLRTEILPMPQLSAGEVVVNVRYVALCGSDIKLFHGTYTAPHSYPIVLGHEWVGEIESVTPAAAPNWKIGEIVTGDCSLFCGACPSCAVDKNYCQSIQKRGITQDGACAQHIAVNSRHLHHCPAATDIRPYALTEPISVAMQGIRNRVAREQIRSARKALIVGSGGIGISALLALLPFDIPSITIVDPIQAKIDLVSSFQLKNVTTASELPANADSFNLIIEAAGNAKALQQLFHLAAPRATVVCLGHQSVMELDCGTLVKKSLNLLGSNGSTGGFDQAIDTIQSRTDLVSKIITRIVPLSKAETFFRDDLHRESNIKILIDLNG